MSNDFRPQELPDTGAETEHGGDDIMSNRYNSLRVTTTSESCKNHRKQELQEAQKHTV